MFCDFDPVYYRGDDERTGGYCHFLRLFVPRYLGGSFDAFDFQLSSIYSGNIRFACFFFFSGQLGLRRSSSVIVLGSFCLPWNELVNVGRNFCRHFIRVLCHSTSCLSTIYLPLSTTILKLLNFTNPRVTNSFVRNIPLLHCVVSPASEINLRSHQLNNPPSQLVNPQS